MSSEKNPEVVGCDASIMKNVWEIRARDYKQKVDLEQERISKSALPAINQEWANRMIARKTGYKRVEKKPKPVEAQPDNNVWKSKQPAAPRPAPGPGMMGRPGLPGKAPAAAAAPGARGKKGQDKSYTKLQSLMYIDQTQPSNLVWGKSWKFNKLLAIPENSSANASDWGQCWMFYTHQPGPKGDKPFPNEPNAMDSQSCQFWSKDDIRTPDYRDLDPDFPAHDWTSSWSHSNKMRKASSEGEQAGSKYRFFASLVEDQRRNEGLASSEWKDCWRSPKPSPKQSDPSQPQEGSFNGPMAGHRDTQSRMDPEWRESWRFGNHVGNTEFEFPPREKAYGPEWVHSWRVASANLGSSGDSESSRDVPGAHDHSKRIESQALRNNKWTHAHYITDPSLYCFEFEGQSEWNNSWQVVKNNSKPSEEIEKTLKASPPVTVSFSEPRDKDGNVMATYSPEKEEQLRRDVIYENRRDHMQQRMQFLMDLQKMPPSQEWRESWRTIKHRRREERRRARVDPMRPFREPEKEAATAPKPSEWSASWKYTCKTLQQQPDMWQQEWPRFPMERRNMQRDRAEFTPQEFPKDGPTEERIWGESWKFSRRQHQSEPGQSKERMSQTRPGESSHDHFGAREHQREAVCRGDWQQAWMFTETQYRHDKPSQFEWSESWRWCVYHVPRWNEPESKNKWVDESAEIYRRREPVPFFQDGRPKWSRSFDQKIFRERFPEKEWCSSWKDGPMLNYQLSKESRGGGDQQQSALFSEFGSKWGRSFRVANPMPQLDRHWRESCCNPVQHSAFWWKDKRFQDYFKFDMNPSTVSFQTWAKSLCFLQGGQRKGKGKSKEPNDPMVIMFKRMKPKKQFFTNVEREKQIDRKMLGCHLLGKTQPRPKKGRAVTKKPKSEEEGGDKLYEDWIESWKFLIQDGNPKRQAAVRSLSGWDESWKFLLPLC